MNIKEFRRYYKLSVHIAIASADAISGTLLAVRSKAMSARSKGTYPYQNLDTN